MAFLGDLRSARTDQSFGNKASNLAFLQRRLFAVPDTICVSWHAFERARSEPDATLRLLRQELVPRIDGSRLYAVRSSANLEDLFGHSFAGQFMTCLDVRGVEEILAAITKVWASAESPAVRLYLERQGKAVLQIKMGVIIQPMVAARYSGVSFSCNPLTGANEVVVEAVEGRGDKLVQEGRTPDRWVGKWGGWRSRPTNPSAPLEVISAVVQETQKIAAAYGRPVDCEWVYDGGKLFWVQMRAISVDANLNVYSNRMAGDMLPGLITPLVWSLNIPLVNGAWLRILEELVGKLDLAPESLARRFYYRAYFNMGAMGRIFETIGMPRDSLELLMGIEVEGGTKPHMKVPIGAGKHVPRLIRFIYEKWGWERRVQDFLRKAPQRYVKISRVALDSPASLAQRSSEEILACIDELFAVNRETAYMDIIVLLLFQMYHRTLRGRMRKAGVDLEQCDMTAGLAELAETNPATHLARLHEMFAALPVDVRGCIEKSTYEGLPVIDGAQDFQMALSAFLKDFGHLSTVGTDITAVPWREDPGLVLRMVVQYQPPAREADRKRFEDLTPKLTESRMTRLFYQRARMFQLYRERTSSWYTYGYGLFRPLFLALGGELVRHGVLEDVRDVFYLTWQEVREAVSVPAGDRPWMDLVRSRREEMEKCRSVAVPDTIYGDVEPPPLTKGSGAMRGVPTSRGYYKGPARVIASLEEFHKMRDGDVLVVPFSDVSWSPLFARAGAVVSESGGMLSHASIIAREYGIPSVMSVPSACAIADGSIVSVDAFQGVVTVDEVPEEATKP